MVKPIFCFILIVLTINLPGQVITQPFLVNDNNDNSQLYGTSIASDNNGNFIITWQDTRRSMEGDIYAQRFTATGSRIGNNFKVNSDQTITNHWDPKVSANGNGEFVIVWMDQRTGNKEIYGQVYNNGGIPVNDNFKANDDTGDAGQFTPSVAVADNGSFMAVWMDERDGYDHEIYAQLYSTNYTPSGNNFKVNDDSYHEQNMPCIAVKNNGGFIIVWEDKRNGVRDVYAQMYSNTGTTIGNNFKVNDGYECTAEGPNIAVAISGEFIITWASANQIIAQRFTEWGSKIGTNFKVNSYSTNNNQRTSTAAYGSDGRFIIAWEYYGNIWFQRFNNNSTPMDSSIRLTGGPSCVRQDVKLWGNYFYTTWTNKTSGSPFNNQIWAQILDWNNPVIVGIDHEPTKNKVPMNANIKNFPNPFNPTTLINYQLPKISEVELSIYNTIGQKVVTLVSVRQNAGYHQVEWDASGHTSGVYFLILKAGSFSSTQKMLLIK